MGYDLLTNCLTKRDLDGRSPQMLRLRHAKSIRRKYTNNIIQFESDTRPLAVILIGITLVCLYGCIYGNSMIQNLSLNGLTETLGIMVTVFFVDQLLSRQEARAKLPLRLIAYRDVQILVSRLITFWYTAFRESVPEGSPNTVAEFLTESCFDKIFNELDVYAKAPALPNQDWETYALNSLTEAMNSAERILERHAVPSPLKP